LDKVDSGREIIADDKKKCRKVVCSGGGEGFKLEGARKKETTENEEVELSMDGFHEPAGKEKNRGRQGLGGTVP